MEWEVEKDSVAFVCRFLGFWGGVQGMANCFKEKGLHVVRFVSAGLEMTVELEGLSLDVNSIGTETVDAMDHPHHEARDNSGWVR